MFSQTQNTFRFSKATLAGNPKQMPHTGNRNMQNIKSRGSETLKSHDYKIDSSAKTRTAGEEALFTESCCFENSAFIKLFI